MRMQNSKTQSAIPTVKGYIILVSRNKEIIKISPQFMYYLVHNKLYIIAITDIQRPERQQ